ncbi:MAG: biotin--[acetyl-CoA-carboxylase] ligase [Verrucomicrobiota bacterium]
MKERKAPTLTDGALILSQLLKNTSYSIKELELKTGLDQSAVHEEIAALREIGFDIQHHPHRGYYINKLSDVITRDELQARLPYHTFTNRVQIFRTLDSTNQFLLREANRSSPPLRHGTTVIAEAQTQGRGRLKRSWESAANLGLWASFLFRPDEFHWTFEFYHRLTLIAAVALQRSIQKSTNISTNIKWPNDLLWNDCKVAGILTETSYQANASAFLVLGIGCNINHTKEDFPLELRGQATSLRLANDNKPIRRVELLTQLMKELENCFLQPWPKTLETWRSYCRSIGQRLTIKHQNEELHGQMLDINDDGHLILRTDNGKIVTINSGDVTTHTSSL